jgi:hypothetical protein
MNGIDAIYDPSDVRRMLAQLREQRLQMEDDRRRKTQGTTKAATTAWGMWNKEQSTRTKELLASGDYVRNPESNWVNQLYTPSGGQVVPSETAIAKGTEFKDIRGPKTISESVGKTTEAIKETSEKSFGSTLGKVASVAGAGLSAYDLATNWKKKSDVDKLLGTASTALYAGSIFNPALGIYALGTSILDQFWD